jgi:Putative transposase
MKAAADAIIELAHDRRFVGGTVGVLAVLHPCLVTGGGISDDGRDWHPARKAFLVPHIALAKLLRGKLKAMLANKRPDLVAPAAA